VRDVNSKELTTTVGEQILEREVLPSF